MMDKRDFIIDSFFAGFFIGVGADLECGVLEGTGNLYLAALIFSMGLCFVRLTQTLLYTGKVGEIFEYESPIARFIVLIPMFIFNCVGAGLASLAPWASKFSVTLPLDKGWWVLLPAILCGVLVHVGTRSYRSYFTTILCVIIFIVAGGQHCVANAYHVAKIGFTADNIVFLLQCFLGNAIGAWIAWFLEEIEG